VQRFLNAGLWSRFALDLYGTTTVPFNFAIGKAIPRMNKKHFASVFARNASWLCTTKVWLGIE
jgi:hypothetical protein